MHRLPPLYVYVFPASVVSHSTCTFLLSLTLWSTEIRRHTNTRKFAVKAQVRRCAGFEKNHTGYLFYFPARDPLAHAHAHKRHTHMHTHKHTDTHDQDKKTTTKIARTHTHMHTIQ